MFPRMVKRASRGPSLAGFHPGSSTPPPPALLSRRGLHRAGQRGSALEAALPAHCPRQLTWPLSPPLPGRAPSISSPAPYASCPALRSCTRRPQRGKCPVMCQQIDAAKYNVGPGNPQVIPKPGTGGQAPQGTSLSLCSSNPPPPSPPCLSAAGLSPSMEGQEQLLSTDGQMLAGHKSALRPRAAA